MALHSTVFKHNILRVSKLRKLTHTTQVYERRFEKNAHECCSLPDLREVSFEQSKESSIDSLQEEKHTVTHVPVLEKHAAQLNAYVIPLHDARSQLMCIQKTLPLFPLLDETLHNDRENLSLPFSVIEQLTADVVARPITCTWDDIILHPVNGSSMLNLDTVLFNNDADSLPEQRTDTKMEPKNPCAATLYCNFDSCKAHTSQDVGREALVLDGCGTDIVKKFSEVTLYLYSNSAKIQGQSVGGTSSRKPLNERPNMDQLKAAEKYFLETLPMFFKKSMDYRMYHPNVIFENNFWGRNEIFTGINQYAMQMAKLRVLAHFRYVNIQLEVISSMCLEEECAVQVQWRIMGLSQFKALKFWRYSFWNYRNSFQKDAEWLEGISTFFINNEGFIIKHQLDRMRPDEEQLQKSVSLSAKLAVLLGLSSPKPGLTDFSSLFFHRQMLHQK